ncbi:MAG: energy transducer TonB [Syntrophorhabdus sp.]|jgi:protein TonB|nr:energy transducer TonB [Syntrophorhabdus sp.]
MTRSRHAGYAVSLLVHLAVAAAVLIIPFEMVARQKSIVLDFSIVRGPGNDNAGGVGKHGPAGGETKVDPHRKQPAPLAKRAPVDTRKTDQRVVAAVVRDHDPVAKGFTGADPQGQVTVAGEDSPGPHAGVVSTSWSGATSGGGSPGAGGGGPKTLNYLGSGGADERNFSFIRDRIMQGIVYPERARRMGWEGKVTLSFTVHENGSIGDVRVVGSSGFSVLDESARDSVAKTNLRRKVPVRLVVLLPVEYRLR